MPLMEVVLNQRAFGNDVVDRFNYMASGTPAAVSLSFALASAIGATPTGTALPDDTLFRAIQLMQSGGVDFIQTIIRAVYLDDDFYGNPFYAATFGGGGDGSLMESPTVAFGFRSNRVKQSIRRGFKRFVGVGEYDTASGGIIQPATITKMNVVKDALGETLTYDDEGNTITFVPCIVQKEKYTTPSGKEAYRYYSSEALQAAHLAIGITWEIYQESRTQVSRQYRRGS